MARKKSETTDVAAPAETAVAQPMSFEEDAGSGFESADAASFAIPYLTILQKNSPQCDPDQGAYIEGAKSGMFFNTVTNQIFDGDLGVMIVPVYYQRQMVEWVPRESGGGFRGSYSADDPYVNDAQRNESGRFVLPSGNFLNDTRYHFCLHIHDGQIDPVIIAMTSTQIKKSRNWMTTMQGIKLDGAHGKFTPPMFSHVYQLTTIPEENEKGNWRGFKITLDHQLGDQEVELYLAAKAFKAQIEQGAAQVGPPPAQTVEGNVEDDVPF